MLLRPKRGVLMFEKLSRRARRPPTKPADVVVAKFAAAMLQFSADFLKTERFNHALTKGEEREAPVQDFLQKNLPDGFGVVSGEVVDPWGNHSPQLDVMVFDRIRNIPMHAGGAAILPAEALLASFEIKSLLTKAEVEDSLKAATKLRSLRPFKRPLIADDRGHTSRSDQCRYFHVLFAYNSNLAATDWLASEYTRLMETARQSKLDPSSIDRIYVAKRGLIHPVRNRGVSEGGDDGLGLMNLFSHLLNFVVRENGNRASAPYDQYFGRLATGWKSLP
jgi:hypothetical protein